MSLMSIHTCYTEVNSLTWIVRLKGFWYIIILMNHGFKYRSILIIPDMILISADIGVDIIDMANMVNIVLDIGDIDSDNHGPLSDSNRSFGGGS